MQTPVAAPVTTARRVRCALLGGAVVLSLALTACSGPLQTPSAGGVSRGSDRPWAPPIGQPEPDPPYTYPRPDIDHGCAEPETMNGFPCTSVPGTGRVIYP
jgi:hypothetical protein